MGPSFSLAFHNDDFAAALQLRVASFPKWPATKTAHTCGCGYICNSPSEAVHHNLGCAKRAGSTVSTRHKEVELYHARELRSRHVGVRLNAPALGPTGSTQHTYADLDILTSHAEGSIPLVSVDYTITSSLSKHGATEKAATEKKDRKYQGTVICAHAEVMGGFSNPLSSLLAYIAGFSDDINVQEDLHTIRCNTAKVIQMWNGRSLRRTPGLITSNQSTKLVMAHASLGDAAAPATENDVAAGHGEDEPSTAAAAEVDHSPPLENESSPLVPETQQKQNINVNFSSPTPNAKYQGCDAPPSGRSSKVLPSHVQQFSGCVTPPYASFLATKAQEQQ